MIPSDFSLNDPHSAEEEMRHLGSRRKVKLVGGEKWNSSQLVGGQIGGGS